MRAPCFPVRAGRECQPNPGHGRSREVTRHALRGARLVRFDGCSDVRGEARVLPREQRLEKRLRQALRASKRLQQAGSKHILQSRFIEARRRDEAAAPLQEPIRDEHVHVGVPVAERTERLDRGHGSGQRTSGPYRALQADPNRVPGGLAQKREQPTIAFEEPAKHLGDCENVPLSLDSAVLVLSSWHLEGRH